MTIRGKLDFITRLLELPDRLRSTGRCNGLCTRAYGRVLASLAAAAALALAP